MAEQEVYDVAVIGAGIVGSATAYHLAKSSNKTLLLEQFNLPHTRGSSHGQIRVIHKVYTQDYYLKMMPDAFTGWKTLEQEIGTPLFTETGHVFLGKLGSALLADVQEVARQMKDAFDFWSPEQLKVKLPQLQIPPEYHGIFDPEAGVLKGHKALVAFQTIFEKHGGKLIDGVRVDNISPGQIVTLHTNQGEFQAKNVVITAGPWTSKLSESLGMHIPLQPARISVNYWKEKNPGEFALNKCPSFLVEKDENQPIHICGLPVDEYANSVKLYQHGGPEVEPDECDSNDAGKSSAEFIKKFIKEFKLNLKDEPCIIERCLFTDTPDNDFVIDKHPQHSNIVIGAGFCGHGFKFAPVIGKLLAELATGKIPFHDTTPFRMDRFNRGNGRQGNGASPLAKTKTETILVRSCDYL